jgi:protein phosphatase 1 regulatory subunit 7
MEDASKVRVGGGGSSSGGGGGGDSGGCCGGGGGAPASTHPSEPPEPPDDPAHRVVTPGDVLPLPAALEELVHVGTQGRKVTLIDGVSHLTRLRVLCLRSNLLRSMAGLAAVAGGLRELELYDNQLRELEELTGAGELLELDVSYNMLEGLGGLEGHCPQLRTLFAASNKLTEVGGALRACAGSLVKLDLGANAIRSTAGLEALVNLEELWLGKNKLREITGLAALRKLRILDVQSNRLTRISGLGSRAVAAAAAVAVPAGGSGGGGGSSSGGDAEEKGGASGEGACLFPALEELYLGHQGISVLEGLDALPSLRTLDVSGNPIARLGGLLHCAQLTDLWAGYTRVATFPDALEGVVGLPALRVLYLEHTPLAADREYRMRLQRTLPLLQQLDANVIPGRGL